MKKKLVYLCMLSLLSVFLLAGCGNKEEKNNPNYNSDNYLSGTHYAMMDVADYGQIYMELYADIAPATVTNFVNLINEGFYNGLTFHRIISNFMMQGGCPEGTGMGSSEYTVPGEFAVNGFNNTLSHLRGTLSMARTDEPDSASSQFFIVHQDTTGLDGYYAAFGRVVSGMEIVDAICHNAIVEDGDGTVLAENQPVITSISIITKEDVPVSDADIEIEEVELPDPEAQLSIVSVDNIDDIQPEDRWIVNEDGDFYLLSSTEDLLSLALYSIDLAEGGSYSEDNILAYSSDFGAGNLIALQINITTEGFPNQLLVAEEHNGAISMYLLSYSPYNNTAYFIPFVN